MDRNKRAPEVHSGSLSNVGTELTRG